MGKESASQCQKLACWSMRRFWFIIFICILKIDDVETSPICLCYDLKTKLSKKRIRLTVGRGTSASTNIYIQGERPWYQILDYIYIISASTWNLRIYEYIYIQGEPPWYQILDYILIFTFFDVGSQAVLRDIRA